MADQTQQQKIRAMLDNLIAQEMPLYAKRKVSTHVITRDAVKDLLGAQRMSGVMITSVIRLFRASEVACDYSVQQKVFKITLNLDKVALTAPQSKELVAIILKERRMNSITLVELFQAEPDYSTPQALAEWLAERCINDFVGTQFNEFLNLTCYTQDEIDAEFSDGRQAICRLDLLTSLSGEPGAVLSQWPAHLDPAPDLMSAQVADKYSRFLRVRQGQIVAVIKPTELK